MNRKVNRELIDSWIDEHSPNGLSELSVRAKVSISTIGQARRGFVPRKDRTRLKLCRALGVNEDALFPPVAAGEGEESA